jgi:polyhydroxyalkanoate synthesis regulator phasin
MQTPEDEFPFTSEDPSLTPIEEENAALNLTSQQMGDLKASLRLVVGSSLSGRDAYVQRLRQAQAAQELVKPGTILIDESETFRDQLRYLLLGILFETPDLFQRGLASAEKASAKVYGLFSKILSPFTNSWMFSPVRNRYDYAAARGEKVIDRLIMKGRREEQNSRRMLQQKNVDDLVNELLEYVILKTEVQGLIEEAGTSVAGDVLDEFREQSAAVDTNLEVRLKSIFRKRVPSQPVTPSSDVAEGG